MVPIQGPFDSAHDPRPSRRKRLAGLERAEPRLERGLQHSKRVTPGREHEHPAARILEPDRPLRIDVEAGGPHLERIHTNQPILHVYRRPCAVDERSRHHRATQLQLQSQLRTAVEPVAHATLEPPREARSRERRVEPLQVDVGDGRLEAVRAAARGQQLQCHLSVHTSRGASQLGVEPQGVQPPLEHDRAGEHTGEPEPRIARVEAREVQ